MRLANRIAIVTDGAVSLDQAICRTLASDNYLVGPVVSPNDGVVL